MAFKTLEDGYATDGAKAFFNGTVITQMDAAALLNLGGMGYAKTGRQVFHEGRLMTDADAATFARTESFKPDCDATDKSGRFSAGLRLKP